MLRRTVLAAALAAVVLPAPAQAEPFTFVALGDMPYGLPKNVFPPFEVLIDTVNALKPAFVVHIGDTKSGSTPCDNAMLDAQLGYLNRFDPAAVYSLGDNEWTDCYRKKAGQFDPLERLDYIRRTYFADPSTSFGVHPLAVESQAVVGAPEHRTYVENTRFTKDGVMFVQAHVVGSNNNLENRNMAAVAEYFARDAANVAWLNGAFDKAEAEGAKALAVAIQADMFEFGFGVPGNAEAFVRHSGFKNFGDTLVKRAKAFDRPVLLIYGDSHQFRVWRPFPKGAPKIMALEVFGAQDMHAVLVSVDPDDLAVFGFKPVINPARPFN